MIIDAGSNIGLSVLYFKRQHPNAKVIAFEPDPDIFKLLSYNVQQSRHSGVELHEAAAWVDNNELPFFIEGSLGGSTEVDFEKRAEVRKVKAKRLRDFFETSYSIDFLKIDIEGGEHAVLPDIADCLPKVQNLFLEYHSTVNKPQALDGI